MITLAIFAALTTGQCGPGGCPPARYAPASPPALHILADSSGKSWSSPDPNWLSQWVSQENARIAALVAKPVAKPSPTDKPKPAEDAAKSAVAQVERFPPTGVVTSRLPHVPTGGAWYGGNVPAPKSGVVGATEDAGPDVYLTVIGPEVERKAVMDALSSNPGLADVVRRMGDRLAVHDYAPDDPMVADVGLPADGRPDVVIQDAKGKVRYRAHDDPGPVALMAELRKADPAYDPANDPTGGWSLASLSRFFGNAEEQAPILAALAFLGIVVWWTRQ